MVKYLNNNCLRSEFSAQLCRNWKIFPLQEVMCNYNKTQVSPQDPTKFEMHSILCPGEDLMSNNGQNFEKTVSFDVIVHFIDEESIVTYVDFDCGITFYPETPTRIRSINREHNYVSRSCEKPKCIPGNNQLNCSIDEQHSSNFFWTRTISETWFQQHLCHSTTLKTGTLWSITTLNQQLTDLEQTHILYSPHCERWTEEGRDFASASHSFKEIN